MTIDRDDLAGNIARRTGHVFRTTENLVLALTHVSAKGAERRNYERLEFLGDRVLGLAIAQMLFKAFPDADEGELSRRYNALVNAEALAEIADELELSDLVVTGAEIRTLRGRKAVNLRADVVESLIAAIYLDAGLAAAAGFVERFWRARALASDGGRRDPKTELQEWAHRVSGTVPVYATVSRTGPDHDPVFVVQASVEGYPPETGSGSSKRQAEQRAATAILRRENVWNDWEETK